MPWLVFSVCLCALVCVVSEVPWSLLCLALCSKCVCVLWSVVVCTVHVYVLRPSL